MISLTLGAALLASRELHGGVGRYGLIVGAYGAGNIVSNLLVGSRMIRRQAVSIFSGFLVMGGGFLLMVLAPSVPLAMLAAGLAAFGGPMGDLPIMTMLQTDFPASQIGKVYSLSATTSSAGGLFGLLLAAPLYTHLNTRIIILFSSLVVIAAGAASLTRFGWSAAPLGAHQET